MTAHVRKTGSEDGFGALIMVMLLAMLMLSFASVSSMRSRRIATDEIVERSRIQAFQAAEGGLAKARHELSLDATYRGERFLLGYSKVEICLQPLADKTDSFEVFVTVILAAFGELGTPISCRIQARLLRGSGLPQVSSWREIR